MAAISVDVLAPDGRVFHAGPNQDSAYIDTTGAGQRVLVSQGLSAYRSEGAAVMYAEGKILAISGAPNGIDPPTRTSEAIDLNLPNPQWRTLQSQLAFPRRYATPTLLPDGSVLLTGGTTAGGFNNPAGGVLAAELWNPSTEEWTTLAAMEVKRIYHSTAVLLLDGRVLVSGGGQPAPVGYGDNLDAQVFSPPYLFKGPRPTITSAPTQVHYGQVFSIATPNAARISAVNWIRLSTVTHTFNQNQRINHLSFSTTSTGLTITAPSVATVTPPGHYMLFILDEDGVPSRATVIKVLPAFSDEPVSGSTLARANHILELRQRIDDIRKQLGLSSPYPWTDPTLTPQNTRIRAEHLTDLRIALNEAYEHVDRQLPTYTTDPGINPDDLRGVVIKAAHIAELRAAILAIE